MGAQAEADAKPVVGLLGIAQGAEYPELIPHRVAFLANVTRWLESVVEIGACEILDAGDSDGNTADGSTAAARPAEVDRAAAGSTGPQTAPADAVTRHGAGLEAPVLDGLLLVALSDLSHAGSLSALDTIARFDPPVLLLNIQPECTVGEDWTDYDLRFNGGAAGGQRLARALVAAAQRFSVVTGDWITSEFAGQVAAWSVAVRDADSGALPATLGDRRAAADARLQRERDLTDRLEHHATTLGGSSGLYRIQALDWNREGVLVEAAPELLAGQVGPSAGPATIAVLDDAPSGCVLRTAACEVLEPHSRGRPRRCPGQASAAPQSRSQFAPRQLAPGWTAHHVRRHRQGSGRVEGARR